MAVLSCQAAFGAVTIHLSPAGDDKAPGAAEAPVKTIARVATLISERADLTEIVIHEGVYRRSFTIRAPGNVEADKLPPEKRQAMNTSMDNSKSPGGFPVASTAGATAGTTCPERSFKHDKETA